MENINGMKTKEKKIYNIVWRKIDIFGAIFALFLSLPLFLLVVLAIKVEDPKGSVLFKQVRVGKDGNYFIMYKFRSMKVGAEKEQAALKDRNEMKGTMFKIKNDPRVTKVGKWLRKTSIDEFPQFINILKGDMSFVGPRPPLVSEYSAYNSYEKQRLTVKPGCTGLWQVSGRNKLSFREMVILDLEYIEKQSILLNLIIILRTFKECLLKGNGI